MCFCLSAFLSIPAYAAGSCDVGEKGGWTAVDGIPSEIEEILRNAKPDERKRLTDNNRVEWFVREDGAYLACVPGKKSFCGQVNYHIEKSGDGWAAPFHYSISC